LKEFLQTAVLRYADMAKLMRKECGKWHPDTIRSWVRDFHLTVFDRMMVDMIYRVVTDLLNRSAERSAEFLG